jgi:hypothetical protein
MEGDVMERIPWRWGATAEEVAAAYPGDRHLPRPYRSLWRAVDVAAPAQVAFRWLCQLTVAPYSYDWIDNLGRRSPRELTPGADRLVLGQRVMTIFRLVEFEPGRHLTLRTDGCGARLYGDLAVTYAVRGTAAGTRLVAKLNLGRRLPLAGTLLAWGDLVMMRRQLLTLRDLAEGRTAAAPGAQQVVRRYGGSTARSA